MSKYQFIGAEDLFWSWNITWTIKWYICSLIKHMTFTTDECKTTLQSITVKCGWTPWKRSQSNKLLDGPTKRGSKSSQSKKKAKKHLSEIFASSSLVHWATQCQCLKSSSHQQVRPDGHRMKPIELLLISRCKLMLDFHHENSILGLGQLGYFHELSSN